mgnify:CR=1 FL=1
MRAKDIEVNQILRHKDNGYFFRVVEVMKPNTIKGKNYIIVKGKYSQSIGSLGITKHFRPRDLEKIK